MSTEKIRDPRDIKHWLGNMETDYVYTLGVAGERFFREIKENAKILGAKCEKCNIVFVPPKMYCERCFGECKDWVEVKNEGTVHTYTVVYVDDKNEPLEKPVIFAFVEITGAEGGFIHMLGEVNPEDVFIGMEVEAVFEQKDKRSGSITDIKYFKPV
ncbi:MAG: Zn-ribbon domain-containing OB-fold protein [Promethearchaeota archaeon]